MKTSDSRYRYIRDHIRKNKAKFLVRCFPRDVPGTVFSRLQCLTGLAPRGISGNRTDASRVSHILIDTIQCLL